VDWKMASFIFFLFISSLSDKLISFFLKIIKEEKGIKKEIEREKGKKKATKKKLYISLLFLNSVAFFFSSFWCPYWINSVEIDDVIYKYTNSEQ
jgi:hypothetical protein